jgi:hypothetical protein
VKLKFSCKKAVKYARILLTIMPVCIMIVTSYENDFKKLQFDSRLPFSMKALRYLEIFHNISRNMHGVFVDKRRKLYLLLLLVIKID